jgi:hypothetical protein
MLAEERRQRGDLRPPAHDHARARARQLLVVGVEQHRVGRPALEQRVAALEHLLERARLVVVAALDVEDRQVEKPAAGGRRGPRQQVLRDEQTPATAPSAAAVPRRTAVEAGAPRRPSSISAPLRPRCDLRASRAVVRQAPRRIRSSACDAKRRSTAR